MLQKNPHFLSDYQAVHDFVLCQVTALKATESVYLHDLVGRVLAEDIIAPINIPSSAQSAMDGFAFRFDNRQESFEIVDTIYAGDQTKPVKTDKALRIMTGACLPEGFDTVVPFEQAMIKSQNHIKADKLSEHLLLPTHISQGRHVKQVGDDVLQGSVVLQKGHQIGAKDIGLIASLGVDSAVVVKKIGLVILASGNELLQVGEVAKQGMTYDSNSYQIAALCQELPVEVLAIVRLTDDLSAIRQSLKRWMAQADVILTLGGASMGHKDCIKQVFAELQDAWSWKLAMKPAKPFSFARQQQTLLFALPGNPLAAFMSFKLFVVESLLKMSGKTAWRQKSRPEKLQVDIAQPNQATDKTIWLQAIKTEHGIKPIMQTSSSRMQILSQASGFIRLKPGCVYQAGDIIEYWEY
ncbi:molybdopterin molybdotransferase MoeA [Thiomicrorhabdus sediminis]|uniref:Molybdopterin molybdenumtransferase n=1 Tax=Thiomicrorhabdus sediminis TaxID=2580412 RepID=A0A4P9K5I0_9GAMM|nr:molybdopterin molybdotransferase MoeA [Thiomicrorhabdus sediminis]QCU90229.1 molybdopterin molybdotransferase MoeA [Thiomicrorhabdus sediminis]